MVEVLASLKCTSIWIMVGSILVIGNPFISIPGLMASCPFAGCCCPIPNDRARLQQELTSGKCAATFLLVTSIIFAVMCALLAISVHASPCVCVFWVCSWGCNYGLAAMGWAYLFFIFIPLAIFCRQFVTKAGTGIQILQTSASGSTIFVATPSIP